MDAVYAQWGEAMQPWLAPLTGLAILLIPAGLALLIWANRRRFKRRNFAGVEQFSSYGQSVGSRILEGLVDRIGVLLFASGLFAGFAAGYGWWLIGRY
ncbi:MAG: hypothetical protein JXA57_19125 [Armatimonadetes bacterium]|nr:hypothetical protein [Armatimonadota bacterium]